MGEQSTWYPARQSEFEIQAELWSELKSLGYDVRGEVKVRPIGGRGARFDLVVFEDQKPILIIEVKRPRKNSTKKPIPKKLEWYSEFAEAVCYRDREDLPMVLNRLRGHC